MQRYIYPIQTSDRPSDRPRAYCCGILFNGDNNEAACHTDSFLICQLIVDTGIGTSISQRSVVTHDTTIREGSDAFLCTVRVLVHICAVLTDYLVRKKTNAFANRYK